MWLYPYKMYIIDSLLGNYLHPHVFITHTSIFTSLWKVSLSSRFSIFINLPLLYISKKSKEKKLIATNLGPDLDTTNIPNLISNIY